MRRTLTTLLLLAGLALTALPGAAVAQTARAQVIHNAPDPAAATVDVYVNGVLPAELDNLGFREATPFLDVPGDADFDVAVALASSGTAGDPLDPADALATFTFNLPSGTSNAIVASGVLNPAAFAANPDGVATAFTLLPVPGVREAGAGADVDLRIVHGSPDAPTVDVLARNVAPLVDSFAYTDVESYLSVPAGAYTLDVTLGDDRDFIAASFDADLSGLGGGAALVLASGFLDPAANQGGPGFGLIAVLPDGTVASFPAVANEARLQVVHNAPDPAAATVDVYVNGVLPAPLDDLAFRSATSFLTVPAGQPLTIEVATAGSGSAGDPIDPGEALATFAPTLAPGATALAVATGVLDPAAFAGNPDGVATAFTLLLQTGVREAAATSDGVDLLIGHGAPDAPTVGVVVDGGGPTLVDSFTYTDVEPYVTVPEGSYTLNVTLGNASGSVVDSFPVDLTGAGGAAVTVLASGFLNPPANQNGEAFNLLAVFADGATALLPVELTRFGAQLDAGRAVLQWQTAGETNNAGFEVQQRAPGATAFRRLGFVEGAGTTSAPQTYRFETDALAPGAYAFRLRQVDFDGASALSPVVELSVAPAGGLTLGGAFPNPVAARATLRLTLDRTQRVTVALYDVLGRRVRTLHDGELAGATTHDVAVEAAGLASGVYLVRVTGAAGTATRRLTVVR